MAAQHGQRGSGSPSPHLPCSLTLSPRYAWHVTAVHGWRDAWHGFGVHGWKEAKILPRHFSAVPVLGVLFRALCRNRKVCQGQFPVINKAFSPTEAVQQEKENMVHPHLPQC